jgi:hypothetical protein
MLVNDKSDVTDPNLSTCDFLTLPSSYYGVASHRIDNHTD